MRTSFAIWGREKQQILFWSIVDQHVTESKELEFDHVTNASFLSKFSVEDRPIDRLIDKVIPKSYYL